MNETRALMDRIFGQPSEPQPQDPLAELAKLIGEDPTPFARDHEDRRFDLEPEPEPPAEPQRLAAVLDRLDYGARWFWTHLTRA